MKTGALCPSAPAEVGASLIGIIGTDGRSSRLRTPLQVDNAFLEAAGAACDLGKRFRFSSPCAGDGCGHWRDEACGLIGEIRQRAAFAGLTGEATLPPCPIRAKCRWWQQDGGAACSVCSLVVHDPTPG